jgi:hypothetical protein
LLYYVIKPIK